MTRETTKTLMPTLAAWANGETIQYKDHAGGWVDVIDIDIEFEGYRILSTEFRPKPKPFEVSE
ncbi:MAG: hypothetical protein V4563_14015 [Pseudomonadota bacterium]